MEIAKPQHKFSRGRVYFTPMIQLIWIFLQREVLATAGKELWEQEVFIQRPQKKLNVLGNSQYSPVTNLPCVVMKSFCATKVHSSLVTTDTTYEKFSNSHIGRDWKNIQSMNKNTPYKICDSRIKINQYKCLASWKFWLSKIFAIAKYLYLFSAYLLIQSFPLILEWPIVASSFPFKLQIFKILTFIFT